MRNNNKINYKINNIIRNNIFTCNKAQKYFRRKMIK